VVIDQQASALSSDEAVTEETTFPTTIIVIIAVAAVLLVILLLVLARCVSLKRSAAGAKFASMPASPTKMATDTVSATTVSSTTGADEEKV
jgi:hypothetical protein